VITKLELYGIIAAIVLACGAAAYFRGHHSGYMDAKNEAAAALLTANQKVDTLNGQLNDLTRLSSQHLADQSKTHSDQLADALAHVKPVIVRIPGSPVQANHPAGSASGAAGHGPEVSDLPTSVDLAPAELMFAGQYQACRDALMSYRVFYADLQAKVNRGPMAR
jgi:hypothetical protein